MQKVHFLFECNYKQVNFENLKRDTLKVNTYNNYKIVTVEYSAFLAIIRSIGKISKQIYTRNEVWNYSGVNDGKGTCAIST